MGKRSKDGKQGRAPQRKAVQLTLAGESGSSSSSGTETLSLSETFEGQWGPTRWGRSRVSVQPPERFVRPVEAQEAYELIPLVFRCVQTIATNGAMLPIVIKRNGEVLPVGRPSRIRDILTKPNPMMTKFELLEAVFTYIELLGNAYLLKDEQDGYGRPRTLWPLYSALITPDVDQALGLIGYDYALSAGVRFEPSDLLHVKNFNPKNFYEGLGTVQAGARTLEESDNAAAWAASFFENGAILGGVLQTDNPTVIPSERRRIAQEWRELAAGVQNAYKTLILTSGLKYQQIGQNPGDVGLKDLRGLTRTDILMLFGMPPTKIGLYEVANYKAEQADKDFWEQCMQPRVLRVQAKLQELADLFDEGDEVILELPQFKDWKALADIATTMGNTGRVTDNEVRAVMGLPADANGDRYRIPLNVVFEDYTPERVPLRGRAGGKAVSALHQDALTSSAQREKLEAEQLAGKTLTTAIQRFFDDQEARIVSAIESTAKAAGGTRRMYEAKALNIAGIFNRRAENAALYAVGRLVHTFAGERAAGWLKAAAGVETSWSPDDPVAQQILKQLQQREEFRGINETTRTAIDQMLAIAEERKYSAAQIVAGVEAEGFKGIKGIFNEAKQSRTQTIIRNECAQAWNTTMTEIARSYGVTKFLLTDGDHDGVGSTGPDGLSCAERNGLIVDADAVALHCRGSHPNCQISAVPYYGDQPVGGRI